MGIQKIIDPSDPQSVARLLNRVNAIEKASAANTAKLKKAQLQLNEAAALSYQGQGVNNLAFNYDGATSLTWAAAFINDKQGNQYQIPSGSATVVNGTSYNVVFNPEHPTLVVTTTAIATVLAEPNSLLACTLYLTSVNTSFGPGGTGSPANGSVNGLNFSSSSGGSYKLENIQYTPTTISSVAAATAMMSFALPASELAVGQALRIIAHGTATSNTANNDTISVSIGGVTVYAGGTWSCGAGITVGWHLEVNAICTTSGVGGTLEVQGFDIQESTGLADTSSSSRNAATFAFNSTISNTVAINGFPTVNSANVSITERQLLIERLG